MTTIQPQAFLFDATRCIDCRACMVACSAENNVPMDDTRIWVSGVGVTGTYPNLQRATMPYHCMHCIDPACASACPVGAWTKRPDGPVVYDSARCIGCRYCMNACPFGVPHFDWDKGIVDQPLITKCTMCAHRLDAGQEPACVQTCLTGALKFGPRDADAGRGQGADRRHPGKYINHVYGETENGGTSYLIISHVPFDQLGLPAGAVEARRHGQRNGDGRHAAVRVRVGGGSVGRRRPGPAARARDAQAWLTRICWLIADPITAEEQPAKEQQP